MSALRRWAACPLTARFTFSNNAYLKLTTEWIMLHGELAIGSVAAPLAPRLLRCGEDERSLTVAPTGVDFRGSVWI